MPRPTPHPIRILDGFVTRITSHKASAAADWFLVPTTVKRTVGESDIDLPRPFVLVRAGERTPLDGAPMPQEGYWSDLDVLVGGFGQDADDPEAAAHQLAADIERAILTDFDFAITGAAILNGGYIDPAGYTTIHELGEGGAGRFEVIVNFKAHHRWTPADP